MSHRCTPASPYLVQRVVSSCVSPHTIHFLINTSQNLETSTQRTSTCDVCSSDKIIFDTAVGEIDVDFRTATPVDK
jgi:hypothetical protein